MPLEPIALFERTREVADRVVAGTRPDQLGDPTPCSEWDVRALLNHMIEGNLRFASWVTGEPVPDRVDDHVGDDHVASFRASAEKTTSAFNTPGMLERTFPTPLGEGPGAMVIQIRSTDLLVHVWDLARATGQSTDLDPELCEATLAEFRSVSVPRTEGGPFGPEREAPEGATSADRLAAFAGRNVG